MVEGVSTVNAPINVKKDNSARNTAIASVGGFFLGDAIGYKTKAIYKNGALTDEFVKKLTDGLMQKASQEELNSFDKYLSDFLYKNKGKEVSAADIRNFLSKAGKMEAESTTDMGKQVQNLIAEAESISDEELLRIFKKYSDPFYNQLNDYVQEINEQGSNVLKKAGKSSFSKNMFGVKNDAADFILNIQKNIKGWAGVKWGLVTAGIAGLTAYALSKINANKS